MASAQPTCGGSPRRYSPACALKRAEALSIRAASYMRPRGRAGSAMPFRGMLRAELATEPRRGARAAPVHLTAWLFLAWVRCLVAVAGVPGGARPLPKLTPHSPADDRDAASAARRRSRSPHGEMSAAANLPPDVVAAVDKSAPPPHAAPHVPRTTQCTRRVCACWLHLSRMLHLCVRVQWRSSRCATVLPSRR